MPYRRVANEHRAFAKQLRSGQTALEDSLWRELRAKRLDGWKFKRQVPIEKYVVDFICFEARLIVEIDGPLHETAEQRRKDALRDIELRRQGFVVLRFGWDVALGRTIDDIRSALRSTPLPTPD